MSDIKQNQDQDHNNKEAQEAQDAIVEKICSHPHVLDIIRTMAASVVDQALQLPIKQWMTQAQENGFNGVIWFRYERVNGSDLVEMLKQRANPLPEGWAFALQRESQLMLVYDKSKELKEDQIVPIVRALIAPLVT